jgi:poly(3-hydroxybutyrate) depolymerase
MESRMALVGDSQSCGSRLEFMDPRAGAKRIIPLWIHRPHDHKPDDRMVVVMHGLSRNADAYRDGWTPHADRHRLLIVAPEFSASSFPEAHDYNYGHMITADGNLLPREQWLFPLIDGIVDVVADHFGLTRRSYALFGHSAGGQLVHRLATFAWSDRIECAISANAGSYTMPDFKTAFPFGLGGTAYTESDLITLLSRPLAVLLGEADCDPNHHNLPRQPEAMLQGPHRFARGQAYFEAGRRASERLGVRFAWRLATAPGIAHSHAGMAPYAARIVTG